MDETDKTVMLSDDHEICKYSKKVTRSVNCAWIQNEKEMKTVAYKLSINSEIDDFIIDITLWKKTEIVKQTRSPIEVQYLFMATFFR